MPARVVIDEERRCVTTTFDDGSEVVAVPNYDAESYARARSLGYQPRAQKRSAVLWDLTRDHDRLHTLLAEAQGYPVSLALWFAAHPGEEMRAADRVMTSLEERTVLLIQRLLNEGLEVVWAERENGEEAKAA